MSGYSLDLRQKIVESVNKGVPKAQTARRFGVDRATVKRYCKQLDQRGTLEPSKAPGRAPKLDEKAMKLLLEDLEQRPGATHSQREPSSCSPCSGGEGQRSAGLPGGRTPLSEPKKRSKGRSKGAEQKETSS